ncbi:HD domain-containing protein [Gloeothece verrucosa]|uniref:N-methyl-D-aspartate receptor NMDAR2C subunit n=1 Tax=Gloeothece verrucosa (strain PCC 7822) TaxID=497965 RepID=E0UKX3_GLOV7|nr:N-methyl-D-aspartate receptor NMDAR2C subunit [Gloeothece verrucosa]ADN17603.1 N-methyl-D-aspartate receptor NMDAR2C subunit [Gloeothece verrucosa PCC 7822]
MSDYLHISNRERWQEIWQKLKAPSIPFDVFAQLIRAYSLPSRFYHNLEHINDCICLFTQTQFLANHPEEIELAIWFHDAVYNTKRNDNENKSSQWAQRVILRSGLDRAIAQRISALIKATGHQMAVTDRDAQLLVDVDLSILGREDAVFWQYEENIRKEYSWVPLEIFQRKRVEILGQFLTRQHIYYLSEYREMFEEKARTNLRQAIARLSSQI